MIYQVVKSQIMKFWQGSFYQTKKRLKLDPIEDYRLTFNPLNTCGLMPHQGTVNRRLRLRCWTGRDLPSMSLLLESFRS